MRVFIIKLWEEMTEEQETHAEELSQKYLTEDNLRS
jgi:hypothetical protein